MKKIVIIGVIVVAIVAIVVLSARQVSTKGTKVYQEEAKKVNTLVSTVKASGEIQPRVYVNISSQVPGEIVDLRVEEGDRVAKGDVLVQLDPTRYRSEVAKLEANLRLSRINLEKEKTAMATHASTLRRQEELARQEIVADETLEQTRLLYETSRIQTEALEEQIRQAEADLLRARDDLSKTTLKAPIDGLVTRVNAKEGEQVIIGTMNNPGTVILVLSDMSELLAEVKVDETEVASVREGQPARVTVDAIEGRIFDGKVSEIAHTAIKERDVSRFQVKVTLAGAPGDGSPATREIPVPAESQEMPGLSSLRPGMSAHAAIQIAEKKDALVVPIQAVIEKTRKEVNDLLQEAPEGGTGSIAAENDGNEQSGKEAFEEDSENAGETVELLFVNRNGKAEMMIVKTGLSDEFNVEVLESELQPGDEVVIGPYRTLKKLKPGEALKKVDKDEQLSEQT